MAMHVFSYRLKCLLRDKESVFWTLAFPVLLATMYHFAFGHLMTGEPAFEPIPVAVADGAAYQSNFALRQMLEAVSADGENQLLRLTVVDREQAERMLAAGEVVGVILPGEGSDTGDATSVSLMVTQSGIRQSILKALLDEYLHSYATVSSIAAANPVALFGLIGELGARESYTQQVSFSDVLPDSSIGYFYALLAMTCLYGGFWGMRNTNDLQADQSPQGARRSLAPTHKMAVVLCDWAAALVVSFGEVLAVLAYLAFALKVQFGSQVGYVLLTCAAGCLAGVSVGTLIGTMVRKSEGLKVGILVGVNNLMCFFAGLMFVKMKDIIARNAPVLSYINPAALISDAFYSLYVFDNHRRFFTNIAILCVLSAAMCLVSFMQLRGERYASL